jgi:hypothetical protein
LDVVKLQSDLTSLNAFYLMMSEAVSEKSQCLLGELNPKRLLLKRLGGKGLKEFMEGFG